MSLLEVSEVRAGYGRIPVLFGIDLTVEEGEVVALLGANGAGKTTTLRLISGLLHPTSGTVTFDGRRVDRLAAEKVTRQGLVHIPEGRGLFPSLTVEETLRLAASGQPRSEVSTSLERVFTLFPRLRERLRQAVGTLSGGERQMLAVSRALLSKPRLVMIDELSQGLAPTVCDEMFTVLAQLPAEGMALLVVEQFVGRALELANRAYVLEKGRVTYAGSAADLAADEDFMAASYLGTVDEEILGEPVAEMPAEPVPALDPERVPLVAELPGTLRQALAELAAERQMEPEELMAKLLVEEARKP